jgi:carboxylesterase
MQQQNTSFLLGPEETSRACLLIHGFSGTSAEMLDLGKALATQGIRVYGIALAGHTDNPDDMLQYGQRHWIASAEEGLTYLARYPHIFVAGLSMGGVLSLLLAIRHPHMITGVIALSTPTRFRGSWQIHAVPLARYFMKWYYPLKNLDFDDPKVQFLVLQQAHLRNLSTKIDFRDKHMVSTIKQMVRIPIPAIAELFRLTNSVRQQLDKVQAPLLIIQSRGDSTIDRRCADELYALTRRAHPKSVHWLTRSNHVITTGPERAEVIQHVIQFIHQTTVSVSKTAQTDSVQMALTDETSFQY